MSTEKPTGEEIVEIAKREDEEGVVDQQTAVSAAEIKADDGAEPDKRKN